MHVTISASVYALQLLPRDDSRRKRESRPRQQYSKQLNTHTHTHLHAEKRYSTDFPRRAANSVVVGRCQGAKLRLVEVGENHNQLGEL